MNTHITFIVPIRHPDNSKKPQLAKQYLQKTLASISAQTNDGWRCIVVANNGTALPEMPKQCEVCYVDFPPNTKHSRGDLSRTDFYDAVRSDKGRRVLAGMLLEVVSAYLMVVDDDDFVHRGLCQFVSENLGKNGWYFKNGYIFGEGSNLIFAHDDFNQTCGTSLIIRRDLLDLPDKFENADMEHVKLMLGAHVQTVGFLEKKGTPLAPLPFYGAMYRVDNVNSHSKSAAVLKKYVFNALSIKYPRSSIMRFFKLRFLTKHLKYTFFGD